MCAMTQKRAFVSRAHFFVPAKPTRNRPNRQEGIKHEHSTVAFKVADMEKFGVCEANADTKRGAQHGSKDESDNCEKTALHRLDPKVRRKN